MVQGGYRKEEVSIRLGKEEAATPVPAIAYIAGYDQENGYTCAMASENGAPTEQYLVAIHGMLREHWPHEVQPVFAETALTLNLTPNLTLNLTPTLTQSPNPTFAPFQAERIEVRAFQLDGSPPQLVSTWLHPGAAFLSLEALVVEASRTLTQTFAQAMIGHATVGLPAATGALHNAPCSGGGYLYAGATRGKRHLLPSGEAH